MRPQQEYGGFASQASRMTLSTTLSIRLKEGGARPGTMYRLPRPPLTGTFRVEDLTEQRACLEFSLNALLRELPHFYIGFLMNNSENASFAKWKFIGIGRPCLEKPY